MNDQELKLIDGLFGQLRRAAAEGGQPDLAVWQRMLLVVATSLMKTSTAATGVGVTTSAAGTSTSSWC